MKTKISAIILILIFFTAGDIHAVDYPIVDTGQSQCYDNGRALNPPQGGENFYGQDAQYNEIQLTPAYNDNGNGTISDLNTGLIWVKARGEKITWADAVSQAAECRVGGFDDWRMPTIKELYSLIDFRGNNQPTVEASTPFLDTDYFEFRYGDPDQGERIIDCQDWTKSEYIGFTMNRDTTIFGVNFADGRIKGYPKYMRIQQNVSPNRLYVRYVRGNSRYGQNRFVDNEDSTITDEATGLTWMKYDSQIGFNWEDALAWVIERNAEDYLGYNDWRLPNAKELQSVVDYSRAPTVTQSPAIDPVFVCTSIQVENNNTDYPFYWTNTTHADGVGDQEFAKAVYLCFGTGYGWMQFPPNFQWTFTDVHGAGAQRSDPKVGDPEDFPHGAGPQGDEVRIFNYVRLVRGQSDRYSNVEDQGALPNEFKLLQNYPNPFNSSTIIGYSLNNSSSVSVTIYDLYGREVKELVNGIRTPGYYSITVDSADLSSGLYYYRLTSDGESFTKKMVVVK